MKKREGVKQVVEQKVGKAGHQQTNQTRKICTQPRAQNLCGPKLLDSSHCAFTGAIC